MKRADALESAYEEAVARAEHALEERNEAGIAAARAERAAHEAIMEREELEDELLFARNMLADASLKNRAASSARGAARAVARGGVARARLQDRSSPAAALLRDRWRLWTQPDQGGDREGSQGGHGAAGG